MIRPLLVHCMTALYPRAGDLPGLAELDPDAYARKVMGDVPWLMWFGVVGGILVFVSTPILTVRRPAPSFLLSAEKLDEHANAVASHPNYAIRQAMFLLKMIAALHWGSRPEVLEHFALPAYPADPDSWRTS